MRGIAVTAVATTSATGDVLMYISTEVFIKTELDSMYNVLLSSKSHIVLCDSMYICNYLSTNKN